MQAAYATAVLHASVKPHRRMPKAMLRSPGLGYRQAAQAAFAET
jgi:hypothetical protein